MMRAQLSSPRRRGLRASFRITWLVGLACAVPLSLVFPGGTLGATRRAKAPDRRTPRGALVRGLGEEAQMGASPSARRAFATGTIVVEWGTVAEAVGSSVWEMCWHGDK